MLNEPVRPQPKPRSRVFAKIERERIADQVKRETFATVDERDKRTCRCCGRKGNPNATTTLGRIHRAHIQDASRGGSISTRNLCSLCWVCHCLEHAKQLRFVGADADSPTLGFEIDEAAVLDCFGAKLLPRHVHIVTQHRGE